MINAAHNGNGHYSCYIKESFVGSIHKTKRNHWLVYPKGYKTAKRFFTFDEAYDYLKSKFQ